MASRAWGIIPRCIREYEEESRFDAITPRKARSPDDKGDAILNSAFVKLPAGELLDRDRASCCNAGQESVHSPRKS